MNKTGIITGKTTFISTDEMKKLMEVVRTLPRFGETNSVSDGGFFVPDMFRATIMDPDAPWVRLRYSPASRRTIRANKRIRRKARLIRENRCKR